MDRVSSTIDIPLNDKAVQLLARVLFHDDLEAEGYSDQERAQRWQGASRDYHIRARRLLFRLHRQGASLEPIPVN